MIEIKRLPPERWEDYKSIRLEALKNDPLAFGSSYEEEVELTEAIWKERTTNSIFAFENGILVGIIVYLVNNKLKNKHIANIYSVYVKEEFRGNKIGEKLLKHALEDLQNNEQILKIKLTVNPEQKAAVKLYEKHGFVLVGRLKSELKISNKYYDELILEKYLK